MATASDIKATITVTGKVVGFAYMKNYQRPDGKLYLVPTYEIKLEWTDEKGSHVCKYEVIRFGPGYNKTKEGKEYLCNSGLAGEQGYQIDQWDPNWRTQEKEAGKWHVNYPDPEKGYLIHDGPDSPRSTTMGGATSSGCIELCGEGAWEHFRAKLLDLTGIPPESASPVTGVSIKYEQAKRPALLTEKQFNTFVTRELHGTIPQEFKFSCDGGDPPPLPPFGLGANLLPGFRRLYDLAMKRIFFVYFDPLVLDLNGNGIPGIRQRKKKNLGAPEVSGR